MVICDVCLHRKMCMWKDSFLELKEEMEKIRAEKSCHHKHFESNLTCDSYLRDNSLRLNNVANETVNLIDLFDGDMIPKALYYNEDNKPVYGRTV